VVGSRDGTLKKLIDALKFERVASAAEPLASLLDSVLPVLPPNTVVVALPTIPNHIRQRGYDQTLLIARHFTRLRNLALMQALARQGTAVQRGQTKQERMRQARIAFKLTKSLDPRITYLLIDDVVTTNASVRYAAEELRNAGATTVWVAVLARQELDKSP
jgi:ComF family protein